MTDEKNILGQGIYDVPEAARLLGVSSRVVRGWFLGWPNSNQGPILQSDYLNLFGGDLTLSFLDFVDTAVAVTLRTKHHVSAQTIRELRARLAEEWQTEHPFSREEFYASSDGRQLFCTLADKEGESHFVEILKNQFAMRGVLLPFLTKVEYSKKTHLAQTMELMDRIVLDPRRKYGKPTVRGTGMATAILFDCYKATNSLDVVADWYNVGVEDVEAAVQFELGFSGIAA